MIDFELSSTQGDITVRLSGCDRNDMIPMLGYIVSNNCLSNQIKRYFMSVFRKSYNYAFCKRPEDIVLKSILICPDDICFILQHRVKANKILTFISSNVTADITMIEKYDWCEDEEVFNYIESDERFLEPDRAKRIVMIGRGD